MFTIVKKRYEKEGSKVFKDIANTPNSIVDSITGKIKVLAKTDQSEKVLKVRIEIGKVEIVQLIVGSMDSSI